MKFRWLSASHARKYVTVLVIERNDEKSVYCPEKGYVDNYACLGRCPYGKVVV